MNNSVVVIDFDRPCATKSGTPVEILRANLPEPWIALGVIGTGKDRVVGTFNRSGFAQHGAGDENHDLVNVDPEPCDFVPRTLRVTPEIKFSTREGRRAELVEVISDEEWLFRFLVSDRADDWARGVRTPKGLRVGYDAPHPHDIVEVVPPVTRFVRVYDKSKTSKNPTRCENWYEFNSLQEARANLQGVRAIVEVTYREGDNLSWLE